MEMDEFEVAEAIEREHKQVQKGMLLYSELAERLGGTVLTCQVERDAVTDDWWIDDHRAYVKYLEHSGREDLLYRDEVIVESVVTTTVQAVNAKSERTVRLSVVVAKWVDYNVNTIKAWGDATRDKYQGDVDAFIILLEDPYVEDISRKVIHDKYVPRLVKMPTSIKSKGKYRVNGDMSSELLPIDEILKINESNNGSTISASTVAQKITNTMSFLGWAYTKGWFDEDYSPAIEDAKRISNNAESIKVLPFSKSDLELMFTLDTLSKACKREGFVERKLVPLIALFTGARLGEIGQLHLSDIRSDQGIWYFDITTDDADDVLEEKVEIQKTLKNNSSKRKVPIHETLIQLGFLDYYHKMKKGGETLLFPKCKKSPAGAWGRSVSRWFNGEGQKVGYMRDCGVNKFPSVYEKKVFHSFRHTFINQFKQLEIGDAMGRDLTGHAFNIPDDVHRNYESAFSLDKKKVVIDKVNYDVDFDSLILM